MRKLQALLTAGVVALGFSAVADENVAAKMQRSLDEANEMVNRELRKAGVHTTSTVDRSERLDTSGRDDDDKSRLDKINEGANRRLEDVREEVPGVKKLQDATNQEPSRTSADDDDKSRLDKINEGATRRLENAREKVPGVKELQDATNQEPSRNR